MSRHEVYIVCACGDEATHVYETWSDYGEPPSEHRVCKPCGERHQAQVEELMVQHCELVRSGVDERMADRVIAGRVRRGELLSDHVFKCSKGEF